MKIKFNLTKILIIALSLNFTSCSLWYNFKAYFNTYYNAKVIFDEAEKNIQNQAKDPFAFIENTIPAQDFANLNKVIEKTSNILQFDTQSSYFIDALWLSGKSFYYQKEYPKAARKFNELLSARQSPEKLLESNLWLGKTELQMRNFEQGMSRLNQVSDDAIKLGEDDIFAQAVMEQIAYLFYREQYDLAIEKCKLFVKNAPDNDRAADVAYELGKLYSMNGDNKSALEAFKSVLNLSPSFEIEYKSKLEYAKCLLDMGGIEEGTNYLNDMRSKTQYKQYLPEILVEVATGMYLNKDYMNSLELFTQIDTTYTNTTSSGIAEYMKAQIYEYHLINFDSASVYYEYANLNELKNQDMMRQVNNKMNVFGKYLFIRNDIKKTSKQIAYRHDRSLFLSDSLLYADAIYKDTLGQGMRLLSMRSNQQPLQMGQNQNQLGGNLNQGNAQNMGRQNEEPNVQGNNNNQQDARIANQFNTKNKNNRIKKKVLPDKPEKPRISDDSLKTLLSDKYYNYANLFFGEMDLPDSASYYYNKILTEYAGKPIIPKTYYALGIYYSSNNEKKKADSLFQIVYDNYKNTDLANQAAIKLGLVEEFSKNDPAENAYSTAENKYFDKDFTGAISDFRKFITIYPKSKLAPKAAYYVAFIFENDIKNLDSTTVAYEYLITKFPNSEVAAKTKERNQIYQDEKKRKLNPQPQVNAAVKNNTMSAADSIKMFMNQAKAKEALKEKLKRQADSLKALQR